MTKFSKADWKLGAIYRVGARRSLPRQQIEALVTARCGLNAKQATQLVGHWLTSQPYRRAA